MRICVCVKVVGQSHCLCLSHSCHFSVYHIIFIVCGYHIPVIFLFITFLSLFVFITLLSHACCMQELMLALDSAYHIPSFRAKVAARVLREREG